MINKINNNILKTIIILFEYFTNFYVILFVKHKYFTNKILHRNFQHFFDIDNSFGILIQGQFIKKNNFTLNTLLLYKYIYPNINIVLSTWDDLDQNSINKIKKLNIYLLLNKKPANPGLSNINLQIVSTINGINFLKKLETKYILKTRTDQRINKNLNFLLYFKILQDSFPLQSTIYFKKRIITTSLNTFKSRLYGVSDMLTFGLTNDLLKYWDIPLELEKDKKMVNNEPKFYIKNNIAEGYIMNNFFRLISHVPNWTQNDSLFVFTSYFYIVDKEQIDLYWLKYERYFGSLILKNTSHIKNWELFENADWHLS